MINWNALFAVCLCYSCLFNIVSEPSASGPRVQELFDFEDTTPLPYPKALDPGTNQSAIDRFVQLNSTLHPSFHCRYEATVSQTIFNRLL